MWQIKWNHSQQLTKHISQTSIYSEFSRVSAISPIHFAYLMSECKDSHSYSSLVYNRMIMSNSGNAIDLLGKSMDRTNLIAFLFVMADREMCLVDWYKWVLCLAFRIGKYLLFCRDMLSEAIEVDTLNGNKQDIVQLYTQHMIDINSIIQDNEQWRYSVSLKEWVFLIHLSAVFITGP